jgi:hypothetical protein
MSDPVTAHSRASEFMPTLAPFAPGSESSSGRGFRPLVGVGVGDTSANRGRRPKILILSSQLLTDRIILYSGFLPRLEERADPVVWSETAEHPRIAEAWRSRVNRVRPFPTVGEYRHWPERRVMKLNQFVWDRQLRPATRTNRAAHVGGARTLTDRMLWQIAAPLATMKLGGVVERLTDQVLRSRDRSPEATALLREEKPDLLLVTRPHFDDQPAIYVAARKLGIPTAAMMLSWDNITTKRRLVHPYDAYIVWSERMAAELHEHYPRTREVPTYVTGAPQFDVFHDPRYVQSREEYCEARGLDPAKPIIVYALGSPNRFQEHFGALHLAGSLAAGVLGNAQIVVRPHPLFDYGSRLDSLRSLGPRVVVQQTSSGLSEGSSRTQGPEQITEWVSTFRHAAVVVNLSSTSTIDAALFDCPVVNLNFDPAPEQELTAMARDINAVWTHFAPIAQSGGVWLVDSLDEMVDAVVGYLRDPGKHREGRRWIAEYVCGFTDGRCGVRLADAVLSICGRSD